LVFPEAVDLGPQRESFGVELGLAGFQLFQRVQGLLLLVQQRRRGSGHASSMLNLRSENTFD
jgi:hypothetical protein